jgi:hypothetical protein
VGAISSVWQDTNALVDLGTRKQAPYIEKQAGLADAEERLVER